MGARERKRSAYNIQRKIQLRMENTYSLTEHIVIKDFSSVQSLSRVVHHQLPEFTQTHAH